MKLHGLEVKVQTEYVRDGTGSLSSLHSEKVLTTGLETCSKYKDFLLPLLLFIKEMSEDSNARKNIRFCLCIRGDVS